jgi:hypothetical protein
MFKESKLARADFMVSGNMIINFKDYTISGNKIIYPLLPDRRKTFHDSVAVSVDYFRNQFL